MPHIIEKLLKRAIILLQTSPQLEVCKKKVMGLQSHRNPNFWNFEIPNLWVPGQNDIWVQALWPGIENTIRGKVMASPKFGPCWVFWICVCPWFVCAPKMLQLRTNQLVVWFVWFVWIIDPLVTHPSPHPIILACHFTHEVLWARERTPTPSFPLFFIFGLAFESFKECGGASIRGVTFCDFVLGLGYFIGYSKINDLIVPLSFFFFTLRWFISMSSLKSLFWCVCGGNPLNHPKIKGGNDTLLFNALCHCTT
jgi:hypothetical protein